MKNLVAADRYGNWDLHVGAIWSSMPVFRGFDAISYLRNASIDLEKLLVLQHKHLSLSQKFVQGFLVLRHWQTCLHFVSIRRFEFKALIFFLKGQGEYVYIGPSGDLSVFAKYEFLFHDMLKITSLVNLIVGKKPKQASKQVFIFLPIKKFTIG